MSGLPLPDIRHSIVKVFARYRELLRGRDKGTVAITFLIALMLLMLIIGVLLQLTLEYNARITVDRAGFAAARAAMTSIPTDPQIENVNADQNIRRAALTILATISPVASTASPEGQAVADALAATGEQLPDRFAQRYTYAEQATTFNILYPQTPAKYGAATAQITITYQFDLTVPGAMTLVGTAGTIAGVQGHFIPMAKAFDGVNGPPNIQLSHGRETNSDADGNALDTGVGP